MIQKTLETYLNYINYIDGTEKSEYMKKRSILEEWKTLWNMESLIAKNDIEKAQIRGIFFSINNKMQENLTWEEFRDLCKNITRRYM